MGMTLLRELRHSYHHWVCPPSHSDREQTSRRTRLAMWCLVTVILISMFVASMLTSVRGFSVAFVLVTLSLITIWHARSRNTHSLEIAALNTELLNVNAEFQLGMSELADRQFEAVQQQAFLEGILDAIVPDVVLVIDSNSCIIRCNTIVTTMFGWGHASLRGKTLRRFFATRALYDIALKQITCDVLEYGHAVYECEVITRERQIIRMEFHATYNEQLGIFITVGRDVTERFAIDQELQNALIESERVRIELETVFDNVQDSLVVYGTDARQIYTNKAHKKLFPAFEQKPMGNDSAYDIPYILSHYKITNLDGTEIPLEDVSVYRALRGEQSLTPVTQRITRPDGVTLIVQSFATQLLGARGEQLGALAITRDVTNDHRNVHNLEVIRDVAHACAIGAEESVIADSAIKALMAGLPLSSAFIVVRDEARPGFVRLLAMQSQGDTEAQDPFLMMLFDTPISPDTILTPLKAIATGEAYFDNISPQREMTDLFTTMFTTSVPLSFNDEIVGALTINYGAHALEKPEHDLVVAIADELATSLHRARLYEEARRLALFDPHTGLHNHRSLQMNLVEVLAAASNDSTPVSVIMLDIDHFRHFNETYGHDIGDLALRSVAHAIKSVIRSGDCAARYGGEEFTIILPGTDAARAGEIAERIRIAIMQQELVINGIVATDVTLTASLGHATFPLHASIPAALLKAADLALYDAKHGGRNAVVAYTMSLLPELAASKPAA